MSEQRRAAELQMGKLGIAVPTHLPDLECVRLRQSTEVAERALCLFMLASIADSEVNAERVRDWCHSNEMLHFFDDHEKPYLERGCRLKKREAINLLWLIEALFTLLWAGQVVEEAPFPPSKCDVAEFPNIFPPKMATLEAFLTATFNVRPLQEILVQAETYYCLDWALVEQDAKLRRKGINRSIVVERRRALEWLISDKGWYEISLDT